jgi:antitoxin VapB
VPQTREVRLFKLGRNQAVRIPVEFELPGETAVMRRGRDRLIIEQPIRKTGLLALLTTVEPIAEEFPDFDAGLLPPENRLE